MDFLGDANLLSAEVSPAGDLLLPGGAALPLPAGADARPRRLRAAIRPEHVAAFAEATDGAIPATVQDVVYKGAHAELYAVTQDGSAVSARISGAGMLVATRNGDTVWLRPDPEALLLFEEDSA
jgi:ABC-type Fe3+/spermidine/putrescine transport system ATPase subunit